MARQKAEDAEHGDLTMMSAVVAQAAQALTAPILSSPISARSRVRWAIIASSLLTPCRCLLKRRWMRSRSARAMRSSV
jgi:hypothetical protein